MNLFDLFSPFNGGARPASTVDQVMRDAKQPKAPFMLGGPEMPTQDVGQVGPSAAPPRPQLPALLPPPRPSQPAPPPGEEGLGEDVTQQVLGPLLNQQPSPGGAPVSTGEAGQAGGMPRADLPGQSEYRAFKQRKRQTLMQIAEMMSQKGSPAMRVQGVQLMFEVQKDYEEELAAEQKKADAEIERQKMVQAIEQAPADETDKARARAVLAMPDVKAKDVQEALRFNDSGAKERSERKAQFMKWGGEVQTASRDLGTLEVNAERAMKIIDEGWYTTGTPGYISSFVPGSAHNQLKAALDPIASLTGYGYLQEMRQNSPTGGAVGNVTEQETKWLMGIQGSLDPVNNDPKALKENIRTIVEGKKLVVEMRKLVPALEAGDPKAWDKYAELTTKLARNGATIKNTIPPDMRDVPPESGDFEAKYGGGSANR
jgi:hypothetical protein